MPASRPADERFWEKVDKTDDCWIWTAGVNAGATGGYGRFHPGHGAPAVPAHRWSYEQLVGPIPDGLVIDHLCRNRRCVNPEHLEPVTHKTNVNRGISVQRNRERTDAITHCPAGHEYTPENSVLTPTPSGGVRRKCLTCLRKRWGTTITGPIRTRSETHCRNGHEYTEENTHMYKGTRRCKTCQRAAVARYTQRKKLAIGGGSE